MKAFGVRMLNSDACTFVWSIHIPKCVFFYTLFCHLGSAMYEDLVDKRNSAVYVICLKKISVTISLLWRS